MEDPNEVYKTQNIEKSLIEVVIVGEKLQGDWTGDEYREYCRADRYGALCEMVERAIDNMHLVSPPFDLEVLRRYVTQDTLDEWGQMSEDAANSL